MCARVRVLLVLVIVCVFGRAVSIGVVEVVASAGSGISVGEDVHAPIVPAAVWCRCCWWCCVWWWLVCVCWWLYVCRCVLVLTCCLWLLFSVVVLKAVGE